LNLAQLILIIYLKLSLRSELYSGHWSYSRKLKDRPDGLILALSLIFF